MRDLLAPLAGQRITVQATVLKHSRRVGWGMVSEPTILLGPVCSLDGTVLTDHVWLNVRKQLAAADLQRGDVVQFSARVAVYKRGLFRQPDGSLSYNEDYGLGYPTAVTVIARVVRPTELPATAPKKQVLGHTVLTTIDTLWTELGEPPSLPVLLESLTAATATPLPALARHLCRLAKAGTITFRPNGSVLLRATPVPNQEVAQ